jgi:hypothetical protein
MTLECIERALISMRGWPGVVACFGGNPCTHSQFPEVCELWKKYVPDQRKRGLWTNNLLKYGTECKETFWPHGRFNLNVHGNISAAVQMNECLPGIKIYGYKPSQHGNQLLDYVDMGVSDEEWVELREQCDINQKWSGAIYQGTDGNPYGYFCERAGALDAVRGTNNGIEVFDGWWRASMGLFQNQVTNCCDHFCGVPLRGKGYLDSEATYGVSKSLVPLTLNPAGKVKVETVEASPEKSHELTDYHGLRK